MTFDIRSRTTLFPCKAAIDGLLKASQITHAPTHCKTGNRYHDETSTTELLIRNDKNFIKRSPTLLIEMLIMQMANE